MISQNLNFSERKNCPICKAESTIVWHEGMTDSWIGPYLVQRYLGQITLSDLNGTVYEIRYCSHCDFYYQTYVPTDAFLEHMYIEEGTEVSLEKKRRSSIDTFSTAAREAERLAILLNKRPKDITILELGAGWGFWSLMAKAYGYTVRAVDTLGPRRKYAESQGVEFYSTLTEIPDASYDVVFSDQVLEHITDPNSVLSELERILKPGGLLRIAVPDASGIQKRFVSGKPLKELQPLEHINGFTHHSLQVALQNAGFVMLPSTRIIRALLSKVRPLYNAHYLQECVRLLYAQRFSTTLYATKR